MDAKYSSWTYVESGVLQGTALVHELSLFPLQINDLPKSIYANVILIYLNLLFNSNDRIQANLFTTVILIRPAKYIKSVFLLCRENILYSCDLVYDCE